MLEFNATFIVAMISFIVFIIIMNAIFYKPILAIIDERKKYIDDLYDDAKITGDKAQKLLDDKDKRLEDTLLESKKIVSDKILKTTDKARISLEKAKKESDLKIKQAKEKLIEEENKVQKALLEDVKNLADTISAKILG